MGSVSWWAELSWPFLSKFYSTVSDSFQTFFFIADCDLLEPLTDSFKKEKREKDHLKWKVALRDVEVSSSR